MEGVAMTAMTETALTTQVHRVYVKASPEAVWHAITSPEQTARYGYRSRSEYELSSGGAYRGFANEGMIAIGLPEVVVEGEVLEADPPHRLVQTWDPHFEPSIAAEAVTRLTWELEEAADGVTKLSVTHELGGAPATAALVGGFVPGAGGGWDMILSDLKTLLETGEPLTSDGLIDMGTSQLSSPGSPNA
jgi:uncharacterized protein YndB with AHSA1/START domain